MIEKYVVIGWLKVEEICDTEDEAGRAADRMRDNKNYKDVVLVKLIPSEVIKK